MTTAEQQTERRIVAALSARAGGIAMSQSTLERAFAEVTERGRRDRERRRRLAAGGAALTAAAAAVAGAFVLGSGLPGQDEEAERLAGRERAVLGEPLVGSGRPEAGERLTSSVPVPLTFVVPEQGDVPGRWNYGVGEGLTVGLDASPATGFANVVVAAPDQVFDPSGGGALVEAPSDAEQWQAWLEETGSVEVVERTELEVGGVPAVRLVLDVADDLPASGFPCARGESCLPLAPDGPSVVGSSRVGPVTSELTVLQVDGQPVVAVSLGSTSGEDQWQPLLRHVVDSLRFP